MRFFFCGKKGWCCFYAVPVMAIWTLNDVIPLMLEDTVNVSVAAVDCPGASVVPCLFHVTVIGPLALVGFQLLVVMPSVNVAVPCVFLKYTVFVTVPPGDSEPQSSAVKGTVHALSEYTPKLEEGVDVVVISPDEFMFILTFVAEYAVSVSAKLIKIIANTVIAGIFVCIYFFFLSLRRQRGSRL
jgi:hypothetical protein